MVTPIYIIAIALGIAFLLPLIERAGRALADTTFITALLLIAAIAGQWLYSFIFGDALTAEVFTAGVRPPLSINLRMGPEEAALLTAVNLLALLGGIYLLRVFRGKGARWQILFLLFTLGMNGIVMTRDIFNLFVFLEILAISSYALIGIELGLKGLTAGFKYAIAGSIAGIFLILGIIFLYGYTGTLNIDLIASNPALASGRAAVGIAIFMTLLALFIEMKQFPANGWALDVYEAAHPGVSAMISAGGSGVILFALIKILPLGGDIWYRTAMVVGIVTFLASNLMALRQRNTTRMLGYSSIGWMGLLLAVTGLGWKVDPSRLYPILGLLFFNHLFSKAGLYWLAGIVKGDDIEDWRVLAGRPIYLIPLGIFVLSLLGLPPFLGFWGKWELIMTLGREGMTLAIGAVLLGSLLEAAYLLRWFGHAVSGAQETARELPETGSEMQSVVLIFAALAAAAGSAYSWRFLAGLWYIYVPIAAALALFLLDWLPSKLKGLIVLGAIAAFAYRFLPQLSGLSLFFNAFFLGGASILVIATLSRKGRSAGFYPLILLLIGSLSNLASTTSLLVFFFAWEIMTASSYLLILRGRRAEPHALRYALFSFGGAFLILAGIAIAHSVTPDSLFFDILGSAGRHQNTVYTLFALGFLVKLAAIGLHTWAPDAYTEADDDVTPLLSGLLSKAGVAGLVLLLIRTQGARFGTLDANAILGWIGALTAFFATLYAVFQEDAKRLLAWSSVGQVGYIVLGLAAMSHLGWVAALYHTVNHLLFKGLLFLAIAGVIMRTGTRMMYEMGGLIKRMPLSFISVLMAIIALSGVPPLTGFGGKWLLYEALIERGWYLQTATAFFASTIAFLYCFRLIHSVFLGQPKPRFREVREAPVWMLIPQYTLIMLIMGISFFPGRLIKPISSAVSQVFEPTLSWQGGTVLSSLGYWNGTVIMMIVMTVFALVLIYLMLAGPRPQKVGQLNIVYAAERPERPETTHFAYRFFRPYERAMAPILRPLVRRFWGGVGEWSLAAAEALRQIYTGNAQTYAIFIFLFALLLYLVTKGVG